MKRILFFVLFFSLGFGFVYADGMVSDTNKDTTSIFEMPTFPSDSLVDVERPVQILEGAQKLARPLRIRSESNNAEVFLEKGTTIKDVDGNILYPLLRQPRKTLFAVAGVEKPKGVIYDFMISFGNNCLEEYVVRKSNTGKITKTKCTSYPEHFKPPVKFEFGLIDDFKDIEFDLVFFNLDTKKWDQKPYAYERDHKANSISFVYPQSGFLAFVKKDSVIKNQGNNLAKKDEEKDPKQDQEDKKEQQVSSKNDDPKKDDSTIKKPAKEEKTIEEIRKELEKKAKASKGLFLDVPKGHWAEVMLNKMIERGVVTHKEDANFNPMKVINRAEASKILAQSFELPRPKKVVFNDFSRTSWFAESAQSVVDLGIISGYEHDSFFPNKELTRLDALIAIMKATKCSVDFDYTYNEFKDIDRSDWFAPYIAFASDYGFVSKKDYFNPNAKVSRVEFLQMVENALSFLENEPDEALVRAEYGSKLPLKKAFKLEEFNHFTYTMYMGDSGEDVKRLKKMLSYLGYFNGIINNDFDWSLKESLMNFQLSKGVIKSRQDVGSGMLGGGTRRALNAMLDEARKDWE
ncbi:MAG: S-layer homology domain-containing protein [Candidatus Gracilibacteria bacterium]|jgi:hypothetical protein|nr:S-layer homology domain-containing protein [Candidatus Gracilibacteria bacterium]